MLKSRHSGFSLVELMIIVAIMADVMVVALPAFLRSRNTAQNARFITDLRTAVSAFEMYAAENNRYPSNAGTGVVPPGMGQYLAAFPFSSRSSIATSWDWEPGYQGTNAALRVVSESDLDDLRMREIDIRMDNGVLSTGTFRKVDERDYYYVIE